MFETLLSYPQAWLGSLWPAVWTLAKIVAIVVPLLLCVAYLTLAERKVIGYMQVRIGPNRVTFFGIPWLRGWGQPIADGLKLLVKEIIVPSGANRGLFVLAPVMAIAPALAAWAVIPFSPTLVLANIDAGLLYILAITSMGVYGIIIAGWASNSKYAFPGALRSAAQMVSYEVALGMSLIPVLFLAGNVTFNRIIEAQQEGLWFVLPLLLSFFVFMVAGFAETNRLPFDLPEAESELIAGYHTEYSAMKWSMFPISEYANMATVSAMVATLFFGGWDIPGPWSPAPGPWLTLLTAGVMFVKVLFFLFLFMWVRWTLPRFRYDQLMALGWKVLLPVVLLYIMVMAFAIWALEQLAGITAPRVTMLILFGLNVVIGYVVFFLLDRNWILSGAYRPLPVSDAEPPSRRAAEPRGTV